MSEWAAISVFLRNNNWLSGNRLVQTGVYVFGQSESMPSQAASIPTVTQCQTLKEKGFSFATCSVYV